MKSFRKVALVLLSIVLLVSMLPACGGTESSTAQPGNSESQNQTQDSSDQVTIEMWYHISPDQAKVLLEKIDEFEKENPGIKVETQSVAFAEIKKQLSIGVAADQLPDLSLCDTVDNASFAAMGAAMDITSEVEAWGEADNYYEGPHNSAMYEGKYYGLPYYSNCLAIMYNKDIFDNLGIDYPTSDWSWDEFKSLVEKTTTSDNFGLTMSLIKSEEGTFNVLPFIWQAGADYNTLNTDGAKEALTMINDFYQNGYMSKELISMTQADMTASLFATGKSAMMVAGTWLKTNIKNENPDLNYGVVTFPTYKTNASPIGGGNIIMMKEENREASWKLMSFLSEKDNSREFSESAGYISSRKDSVEDSTMWKEDEVSAIYVDQLMTAKARGPHPKWPEISTAIQFAYQEILSQAKTVDVALEEAAETISKID
jgi:multiple sugar transport system substrate-binding protein